MSDPYALEDNNPQPDQFGRMSNARQYQNPATTGYPHTPTYAPVPANSGPPLGAAPGGDYQSQRPFQSAASGPGYPTQFNPTAYGGPQYMPQAQQNSYSTHPGPYHQQPPPPMNPAFNNPLPLPAPNPGALVPQHVTGAPSPDSDGTKFKDPTGQVAPPGVKPRVTATLWEDEGSLCFQVEAKGICVARREDNHFINGTKLLNVAGMTRGRRDGILKSEKNRHVVKIGPMHLKGVWIPFERALEYANKEGITESLYPLFVNDIGQLLYHPHGNPTRVPQARYAGPAPAQSQPTTHHHHSLSNPLIGTPATLVQQCAPVPLGGRPGLDRAHTFPTPPSSATGTMPPLSSQGGSSQDWNGAYQTNSANTIALNAGIPGTRSVPATPATTPPGNLHSGIAYSTPQYDSQIPAYSAAPSQQAQYTGGLPQVNAYRPQDSYTKHQMAPPSRAGDQSDAKNPEAMMSQGNPQLGHGTGDDQRDPEHDNDYTHSAQYSNRGAYDYSANSAAGNVPSEMASGQLAASPHQPGSGSQTPRSTGPATQWNSNYTGMPRLSATPAGASYRPMPNPGTSGFAPNGGSAGSYSTGDVGNPYPNHNLTNGMPAISSGKRGRDEDEHTYSRPDSAQGEEVESKRRKTFSSGSVGPAGYVDHANQPRNRPLVTAHDR